MPARRAPVSDAPGGLQYSGVRSLLSAFALTLLRAGFGTAAVRPLVGRPCVDCLLPLPEQCRHTRPEGQMTAPTTQRLPTFDELPAIDGAPPQSAWWMFGRDDQVGMFNLQTPEAIVDAARLIQKGAM